jgi:hypothetical protein
MKIELRPLIYSELGQRRPMAQNGALLIKMGRLQVSVGFWRYVYAKPLAGFFWQQFLNGQDSARGTIRVWRVMFGALWKKA